MEKRCAIFDFVRHLFGPLLALLSIVKYSFVNYATFCFVDLLSHLHCRLLETTRTLQYTYDNETDEYDLYGARLYAIFMKVLKRSLC